MGFKLNLTDESIINSIRSRCD